MKHTLPLACALITGLVLAPNLLLAAESAESDAAQPRLPLEQLREFAEVFGRIKKDYVEPVDDRVLLKYAIEGMLNGLDPHSSYLDARAFNDLREGTSGEFGGLGIEVGQEDGFIKVIAPIDDTPAQRAGIQAGDLIIRLDGQSVKGMSLDDAVERMRGKAGSELALSVMRDGQDKPLEFTLQRAVIKVVSVKHRMLEPGFGYLRISQFQARTTEDLLAAVARLKEAAGGTLKGLVLDLRNNPGGVLNAAVGVSDAFLTDGLIVYTEGRVRDSQLKFKAAPDDVLDGAPLVVLVNGGSASASEIVAGALQDQRRAVIMGRQTFGKGSVQTIVPVNADTAIKLTTARYFTPSGRSIQAEGVTPDIVVDSVKIAPGDARSPLIKESDLSGHLINPAENGHEKRKTPSDKPPVPLVEKDFELAEALNLLKGLAILRRPGAAG